MCFRTSGAQKCASDSIKCVKKTSVWLAIKGHPWESKMLKTLIRSCSLDDTTTVAQVPSFSSIFNAPRFNMLWKKTPNSYFCFHLSSLFKHNAVTRPRDGEVYCSTCYSYPLYQGNSLLCTDNTRSLQKQEVCRNNNEVHHWYHAHLILYI